MSTRSSGATMASPPIEPMVEGLSMARPSTPTPPIPPPPEGTEVLTVEIARRSLAARIWQRGWELLRTAGVRRRLGHLGQGVRLAPPITVYGARGIAIGDRVSIWPHARLVAHNVESAAVGSRIVLSEGVTIHPYAHISAISRITIGAGALFASNVYISDHDHDWRDPNDPVISNARVLAAPVEIGARVWLGERVAVLRGVTIGEGSIVGAASVVTKSIPPYSIAVGAPARVIRRWDAEAGRWVSVP
jgi:acetyltransferase-like isoleucine patch superfamily enzyme